jgi:hypothetical protein
MPLKPTLWLQLRRLIRVFTLSTSCGAVPRPHQTISEMTHMMDEMGWMSGGMGLIGLVVLVALVLGIAALVKYLTSRK